MGSHTAPFVVIVQAADGPRVTGYPTRKAAKEQGRALRASGALAYVYPTVEAMRLGLIPACTAPALR